MRNKKIFVLKIVWRKSIASLHRLTQAVQRANLRRTAGDPTWVYVHFYTFLGKFTTHITTHKKKYHVNSLGRLGSNEGLAPMANEKIKILGAVLELPAKDRGEYNV